MKQEIGRLIRAINIYKTGAYYENEFHQTMESVIQTITESHYQEQRNFLQNIEAELELIDFTTDTIQAREKYLVQIKKIEEWIIFSEY